MLVAGIISMIFLLSFYENTQNKMSSIELCKLQILINPHKLIDSIIDYEYYRWDTDSFFGSAVFGAYY